MSTTNLTPQQVVGSARAGLALFERDTTLIPGDMRRQLSVLELVLGGLSAGTLVVAAPDQVRVQSDPPAEPPRKAPRKRAGKKTSPAAN